MHPVLTYALLGLCAAALVLGFWIEARKEGSRWFRARRFAWVIQVGAILAAYLVLRPGSGADAPRDEIAAARAAGAPIFVDFYSNY